MVLTTRDIEPKNPGLFGSTFPKKSSEMSEILKIVIIGDGGVGKTSIRNNYIHQKFTKSYKATIGADFISKKITLIDKTISLQIWDTAGQERFKSLTFQVIT